MRQQDGNAVVVAGPEHRHHVLRRSRPHHRLCRAGEASGPLDAGRRRTTRRRMPQRPPTRLGAEAPPTPLPAIPASRSRILAACLLTDPSRPDRLSAPERPLRRSSLRPFRTALFPDDYHRHAQPGQRWLPAVNLGDAQKPLGSEERPTHGFVRPDVEVAHDPRRPRRHREELHPQTFDFGEARRRARCDRLRVHPLSTGHLEERPDQLSHRHPLEVPAAAELRTKVSTAPATTASWPPYQWSCPSTTTALFSGISAIS